MKEGALSGGILDPGIMQAMEVTFNRIRAATYLCHLLLPPLLETKGSMIIVSSVAATTPIYGGGASLSYYMCDAAFDMLSKTLACEFGSKGVRVNTVNPGMVDTPSNFTLLDYEVAKKYVEEGAQKSAIGKIIPPEDVAKSIAFLASSASAFITGHSLVVDGGLIYK
ncbi:L-xylulose reductase-like protein [Dinothrombium tinctorium]|uniref:L-xylulose reductase-like protein n=1 Tax=Dinothrombium tinctorium TaxID=1965070 RepID=A0A3S3PDL8_9ACAR|nr:L-xylulose reductase-like protein [Dinothrombium tinctorium]